MLKAAPLARLGYHQWTSITKVFDLDMPTMPDDHLTSAVLSGQLDDIEVDGDGDLVGANDTTSKVVEKKYAA